MLTATRQQQIEIEEHCLNYGTSISDYLLGLHNVNMTYKNLTIGTQPMPEKMIREMEEHDHNIKLKREIENAENSKKSKKKT